MYTSFTTVTKLNIRYVDTDMAGVVHHSNFVVYYEAGRIDYFDQLNFSYATLQAQQIGLVPVDLNITYITPLKFGNEVEIYTNLVAINKASIKFSAYIISNNKIASKMTVKLACMDEKNWKIIRVPQNLIDSLPS
jgi:acyl-CoA thioester hydrolase